MGALITNATVQCSNEMAANVGAAADIMHEVVLQAPIDEELANCRWFCGAGRELFAEQHNGRWTQIEYVFPTDDGLFVMHWSDGRPIRLWRHRQEGTLDAPLSPSRNSANCFAFPATELHLLDQFMHALPHSLWARLIKLALDAHFSRAVFPQRATEPRIERRSMPRLAGRR